NVALQPGPCQTSPDYRALLRSWANNATAAQNSGSAYGYWLPSLNVKFGLTKDLILRGALSRSITPPQVGYVRGDYNLGGFTFQGTVTTPNGPQLLLNPDGTPQQTPRSTASFGNPLLKPESA